MEVAVPGPLFISGAQPRDAALEYIRSFDRIIEDKCEYNEFKKIREDKGARRIIPQILHIFASISSDFSASPLRMSWFLSHDRSVVEERVKIYTRIHWLTHAAKTYAPLHNLARIIAFGVLAFLGVGSATLVMNSGRVISRCRNRVKCLARRFITRSTGED